MGESGDFQRKYRNTIGLFASGVTVVVAGSGDDVRGMTANAVTSVSLDPTMLLFCPGKTAHLSSYCEEGGRFTVNILASDQENTSNHFAGEDMAPEHGFVDWPGVGPAYEHGDRGVDRTETEEHAWIIGRGVAGRRTNPPPQRWASGAKHGCPGAEHVALDPLAEETQPEPVGILTDAVDQQPERTRIVEQHGIGISAANG